MCGRFTLKTPVGDWLAELLGEAFFSEPIDFRPRFNIAPTQSIVIVHRSELGRLTLKQARWGLIPSWAEDLKIGSSLINARSETLREKPSFRESFQYRRCVVVTDGYYEWKPLGKSSKQPFWIHRAGEAPYLMLGLWALNTKVEAGSPIISASIVTRPSTDWLTEIHSRMPLIPWKTEQVQSWLADGVIDPEAAGLLAPLPSDFLQLRPVSDWVGNPRHEDPRCLESATAQPRKPGSL